MFEYERFRLIFYCIYKWISLWIKFSELKCTMKQWNYIYTRIPAMYLYTNNRSHASRSVYVHADYFWDTFVLSFELIFFLVFFNFRVVNEINLYFLESDIWEEINFRNHRDNKISSITYKIYKIKLFPQTSHLLQTNLSISI